MTTSIIFYLFLLVWNRSLSMPQDFPNTHQYGSIVPNNIASVSNIDHVPVLPVDIAVSETVQQVNEPGSVINNLFNLTPHTLIPNNVQTNNLHHYKDLVENILPITNVFEVGNKGNVINDPQYELFNDTSSIETHTVNSAEILENAYATENHEIIPEIDVKDKQTKVLSVINNVAVNTDPNIWIHNVDLETKTQDHDLHTTSENQNNLSNVFVPHTMPIIPGFLSTPKKENVTNQENMKPPLFAKNPTNSVTNLSVVNGKETINLNNNTNNHEIGWTSAFTDKEENKAKDIDVNIKSQNANEEINSFTNSSPNVVHENHNDIGGHNSSDLHIDNPTSSHSIVDHLDGEHLNDPSSYFSNDDSPLQMRLSNDSVESIVVNNTYSDDHRISPNITTANSVLNITVDPITLSNKYVDTSNNLDSNGTNEFGKNDSLPQHVPVDVGWRSDIPKNKIKSRSNHVINTTDSPITYIQNYNIPNKSSINGTSDTLLRRVNIDEFDRSQILENDETKSNVDHIFMILNSGNIVGFNAVLPAAGEDLKTNAKSDLNINNDNTNTSQSINKIIDSAINNVATNILSKNLTSHISKNLFLILNSGSISNFNLKGSILKDSSEDFSDNLHLNNDEEKPMIFKTSTYKSLNPILDIKFRTDNNKGLGDKEISNTESKAKHIIPLGKNLNTPLHEPETKYNVKEDSLSSKDILITEPPVYKSLIPQNIPNLYQTQTSVFPNEEVSDNDHTNLNAFEDNDNNFIPTSILPQPNIDFDLNSLNVFGNAFDVVKRLKRSTDDYNEDSDEFADEKYEKHCTDDKKISKNDVIFKLLKPNRRYFFSKGPSLTDLVETEDFECSLSFFAKLAVDQIWEKFSQSDNFIIKSIYSILSSLIAGKKVPINLVTKDLLSVPFSLKLRLQLLHGDITDFIHVLTNYLKNVLCGLV